MKTDFSIQRINLLLRKDWIENKKKLAYGVLVILGVLFFFLLSSILWATRFRTFTLYVLGSLGTFIAFCSYVNLMIHRPRGLFLTLPASNQEKFAAILIEGIVVFLTYQVTFWTGTGIASMLIHIQPVAFKDIIMTLPRFHHAGVCRLLDVSLLCHIQEVCFRNRLWWIYIDNRFYHRDCLSMHKHLEYPAGYE